MRLRPRLFAAVAVPCVIVALAVVLITHLLMRRGADDARQARQASLLVGVAQQLAEIYEDEGGFTRLRGNPRRLRQLVRPLIRFERAAAVEDGLDLDEGPAGRRAPIERRIAIALHNANGELIGGRPKEGPPTLRQPVEVGGAIVGHVAAWFPSSWQDQGDALLTAAVRRGLVWGLVVALAVAAVVSWGLARRLVRPIAGLRDATHKLAQGDYAVRVAPDGRDELADLGHSVNQMAGALAHQAETRQQLMADVAHELRTPVSIMTGELALLEDGVRPMDAQAVRSLSDETARLGRLIEDIRVVSLGDVGQLPMQPTAVDLGDLTARALERQAAGLRAAGLTGHHAQAGDVMATVDADRLHQVLANLLGNVIRHVPRGAAVWVEARGTGDGVVIEVRDSGPGVPAEALPRLFDRYFQSAATAAKSRGGSGLGLAVCRAIVVAHGGQIRASQAAEGGLAITLTLPREAA